jgi:hypothetical protein
MQEEMVDLVRILRRQHDLLQTAVDNSKKKQKAVIRGDITVLDNLNRLATAQVQELGRLEDERRACVRDLALSLGIEEEHANLGTICDRLGVQDRAPLITLGQQLRAVVAAQMQLNRINEKLISLQLSQIGVMITTLTQPPPSTYTGQGAVDKEPEENRGVYDYSA